MSKKYWVLLTVVLLSLGLTTSTVFAKSEARLISNLLPAPRLDQLNHYLVAQGYTASLEHKTETTLTDIKNDAGQNIQANIRITIVPYTKANSEPARIAYWEGTWESRVYSGSLATIGEKKLMFANARGVQQVKSFNNLKSYVQIPLYAFSGSTPWGMTDTEFDEETSSIPNSDQTSIGTNAVNLTTSCRTITAIRTGYTSLGYVAWKFHTSKYWCYDGSTVSNISVSNWVSQMDPLFYYRGIIAQSDYNITNGHLSMRQGHIQNCILNYGCIGNYYPAAEIKSFKDGSYAARTWQ